MAPSSLKDDLLELAHKSYDRGVRDGAQSLVAGCELWAQSGHLGAPELRRAAVAATCGRCHVERGEAGDRRRRAPAGAGGPEVTNLGPNHRDGCDGSTWVHSGAGYNRVCVCSCGAEDHDPDPKAIQDLVDLVDSLEQGPMVNRPPSWMGAPK